MVYIDTPREVFHRGKMRRTVHCSATDLTELHLFALSIGASPRQFEAKPGKPHYDLFDDQIDRALEAGAQLVMRRELVLMLRRWHRSEYYDE